MTLTGPALERRVRSARALLVALGLALRLLAVAWEPPLHPDEYFQYLEPGWGRLTGFSFEAWEWREGLRSWVLPSYNGAWMALLLQLGVPAGPAIGWLLKAHWAVINALLVGLAFRGGACLSRRSLAGRVPASSDVAPPLGWEGGLLAAALCAAFPLLVAYAGHTLSELPSMLCLVAGLVLSGELVEQEPSRSASRKAAFAGSLLSLGACLRIANGPLTLVPPLWLVAQRRARLLVPLFAGALVPALAFATLDGVTWGGFASSFTAYVRFNFVEDGAATFGTEGDDWYVRTLWARAPLGLPLLLLPALWSLRSTWPYLFSAAAMIAYFSAQPHKEERFVIAFWPLLSIAAAGATGAFIARVRALPSGASGPVLQRAQRPDGRSLWRRSLALWAVMLGFMVIVVDGAWHYVGTDSLRSQDRVTCQSWVGAQKDVTGLLVDEPYFLGGSLWFGSPAPQLPYLPELLGNPVVTHVLVPADTGQERAARAAGFVVVHRAGTHVVLRRIRMP